MVKQFLRYIFLIVALFLATANAWATAQYEWVQRFNGTTTFDNDNLQKITNGEYTNNVKFSISGVSWYDVLGIKRLDYPAQKDGNEHSSNWSWSTQTNDNNPYNVSVTKIQVAVRGYLNDGCDWAKARFNNNDWISCGTKELGEGGATNVSIENTQGLGSYVTFYTQNYYKAQSISNWGEDYATFTLHNIQYTYRVTQRVPKFQYKAVAIASPNGGGNVYASFTENSFSSASVTTTSYSGDVLSSSTGMTKTAYFKAVAKPGYNFVGWARSQDATTYISTSLTYSETFKSTSNDDAYPTTLTLYAIFMAKNQPLINGSNVSNIKVDETYTADFSFTHTSTAKPSADLNADFYFTISHTPDATSKDDSPDPSKVISYDPETNQITALNSGSATITFTHKETDSYYENTASYTVSVIKHTPIFTWQGKAYNETTTEYFNTTYNDYFISSSTTNNTSTTLTYSTKDSEVAMLHAGSSPQKLNLTIFNKETNPLSSIELTVKQAANYYWEEHTETHTITPQNPNNHVPFTIDSEAKRNIFATKYEAPANSWDNGIQLGDWTDGFNYEDKYVILHFTGIPDKLTFNTSTKNATDVFDVSGVYWYVKESTDGTNWSGEIWNEKDTKNVSIADENPIQLSPDTRYILLCYSGNFGGIFHNITVTELNVFEADPTSLNFGAHQVDKTSYPTKTFALHYANAGYKVKLQSTNEKFNVSPTEINTIGGEHYGTYAPITVKYNTSKEHNTDNTGKIIITDECGHQTEVELNGSTYKIPQSLYWTENWQAREPAINVNSTATDLARATSTLEVCYTSSDESIIQVINGTTIRALKEGRATITAYQNGTDDWAQAESISKEFIVTNKIIQYIHWTDNLLRLLTTDEPFALNATIQLADTEGNRTDSPERTAKIKYYSNNPDIVSVEGNILTIHGPGETYVIAYEVGDEAYEQVYLVMPVRVRIPSTGCDPKVLEQETEISFFQMNTNEIIKDAIEIDRTKGIPGKLSFQHKGEKWISIFYTGSIKAQQSTDNGNNWSDIDGSSITPTVNEYKELANLALDERATHIRFVRPSGGQGYHYVKDIEITPAQYIRSNTYKIDFGEIVIGSDETKPFAISYSNMQSEFHMVTSHTDLTLSNSIMVDDCGAWGEETHTVRFKPTSAGAFNETIIVYDDISQLSCTIQVVANIIKGGQDIVWNPLANELRESNDWRSGYTKNAYSTVGLDITYTMQPNAYAHFDANGHLVIDQTGGSITITASQAGNDNFNEATSVSKTFNIPADLSPLTFIGGHAENNWSNTLNWNYNRLPKETESILLQAPAQLTTNATVSGITFGPSEEIGSIHIKPTGGLTIGNNGIIGANADGSSIVIDNTPEGAGFLRIDPTITDTHKKTPRFTVNYTTRAYDRGWQRDEVWQYMGAPGSNAQINGLTDQTLIYNWDEPKGWVKQDISNLNPMPAWKGYALTQSIQERAIYQITATPILDATEIHLTCTPSGMKGDNLFVNSFAAPIDIKKIDASDIVETETGKLWKIFYLFNSGSWNQWKGDGNHDMTAEGYDQSSAGHYYTIPILSAPYTADAQTVIPPMQGVYVYTETPATIRLNYAKHVWNGEASNKPMRSATREESDFQRVRIHIGSENSGADRMYIIQTSNTTRGYDNGYDGDNINANGQANIYTNEPFGKMEVSCANNIDSMYIGITTGEDTIYTLTFGALRGEIYLKDLANDSIFEMTSGGQYHFTAAANATHDLRFQILLHPDLPEDNQNTTSDLTNITGATIWANGKTIYIANAPVNSIATLYNISGQAVLSSTINYTPYTLNVSDMPKGVYILRINNQAYKFVCE